MYKDEELIINGITIKRRYYYDNNNNNKHFILGYIIDENGFLIQTLSSDFDIIPLNYRCFLVDETNKVKTSLIDTNGDVTEVVDFIHSPHKRSYSLSDYLLLHDLIIIARLGKYYLYNYHTKETLSVGFDSMDEIGGHIYVEEHLDQDTLDGELDLKGHLKDNRMTLRSLQKSVYVNENDLTSSKELVRSRYPRLERQKKKRERQKALLEYEYQAYKKQ